MLRVEKAAERVLTSQRAGLKVLGSWCQTYSLKQNHLEAKVGVVAKKSPLADTSGRIISAGGSQRCRRRRRALRPEVFTETAGDTNATPGPLTSQMLQNTAGDVERPMAPFFLCWRRGGRIMFCFLSHRTTLKWTSLHKTGQDFFFPGCLGSFNTKRSLDCTWKRQHSSWGGIGSGCCLWDIWGLFHVTEH